MEYKNESEESLMFPIKPVLKEGEAHRPVSHKVVKPGESFEVEPKDEETAQTIGLKCVCSSIGKTKVETKVAEDAPKVKTKFKKKKSL